jgi:hypothetical protein
VNTREEAIWTAAFAGAFIQEFELRAMSVGQQEAIEKTHGFTCAEIADAAVEKYREAINSDDAKHLLIVKEKEARF